MTNIQSKHKFFYILFSIILIFLLFFCQYPVVQASQSPSNLTVELSSNTCIAFWTGVEDVFYYNLKLNGTLICENIFISSSNCRYDISSHTQKPAIYIIEVCAVNGDKISDYTKYQFVKQGKLDTPTALHINNSLLYWDSVDNSNSYEIIINSILIGCFKDTTLDLNGYINTSSTYNISVCAIPDENNSVFSKSDKAELLYNYKKTLNTPNNISVVFYENKYVFSWTSVADATKYYFCNANSIEDANNCDFDFQMQQTSDCYADISTLICGSQNTFYLVAANENGEYSKIANFYFTLD